MGRMQACFKDYSFTQALVLLQALNSSAILVILLE